MPNTKELEREDQEMGLLSWSTPTLQCKFVQKKFVCILVFLNAHLIIIIIFFFVGYTKFITIQDDNLIFKKHYRESLRAKIVYVLLKSFAEPYQ